MRSARQGVAGFLAGIMAFALLVGGGGAAWAYWTASAQGTGQVTTPSVTVTQISFPSLNATYTNAHARQTVTGPFSISNTGSVAGFATASISSTAPIAAQLPLTIWRVANSAACVAGSTIPSDAVTGTWASATLGNIQLAAGQAQTLCVRTTIPLSQRDSVASATGDARAAGTLNVSLATTTGWTAASTPAVATQTMSAIYPLDTALAPVNDSRWHSIRSANGATCLDVEANNTFGNAIAYQCGSSVQANQMWQVVPVSEADRSLITLRPRHSPNSRLAVDGSNRQVTVSSDPASPAQQWYVQRVSTTTVQFVSATNGLCLSMPQASGVAALTMIDCSNIGSVIVNPLRIPLGFSSNATTTTLTVGPRVAAAPFFLQRLSGGTWTTVTTTSQANALTVANDLLVEGPNTMRIIFIDGTFPAYNNLVLNRAGTVVTAVSGTG
ncbi:RICIN domain-containing protein [Mycetocola zhadangensis]|uniref:Ricin B lectin domain-containing protein n=1 Tax=Mycetocola zhadangensis TaxID=1164595 RepID=A0A3L7J0G6_9MICO|nr:RICIN domain-containing protein [Mycetocola zhadangensis]RLQ83907.1 hypothetical protein D9V28_06545 [Mycetocola zhadangensis]